MPILAVIIAIAALGNFFLGLLVFLRDPSSRLNKIFGVSCLIFSLWVLTNFLLIVFPSVLWLQSTYAFGVLSVVSSIFWAVKICETRLSRFKTTLLAIFGIFFFVTPFLFFSYSGSDISKAYESGYEVGTSPSFFLAYTGYMFTTMFFLIYILVKGYLRNVDMKKMQIGYVLAGIFLHVLIVTAVSFILPLFKIYKWASLDSPSSLFFVVFSMLAITRYRLFEIKVILTEVLVVVMGLVLFILPFTLQDKTLIFLTSGIFLLFCVFGFLLIRSTLREILQKEELEQKVRDRTKDLELAKNLAEERVHALKIAKNFAEEKTKEIIKKKEDLEKFYASTINRELTMIDLKNKIKTLEVARKKKS